MMERASLEEHRDKLLALDVKQLDEDEALKSLALLVDVAFDLRDADATSAALSWAESLEARIGESNAALLDYCIANAWVNRWQERANPDHWAWEQPELQRQIFYLKKAVDRKCFPDLDVVRRCQILTNLANCLSTIGRFVEAQEYWSRVLELNPRFGVARGNRGSGAASYMQSLYDGGHQALFGFFALAELNGALDSSSEYFDTGAPSLMDSYREKLQDLDQWFSGIGIDQFEEATKEEFSLGDCEEEQDYRRWCLENRLFLSPLNDITQRSIAARDILFTPSITCGKPFADPPIYFAFFNQLKQEFVSARWQYHAGISDPGPHFSDSDVILKNTLDYASFGLSVEMVKSAFRSAYSLFDKIGYFINQYFALGVEDKKVSFRSIWYVKKQEIRGDLVKLQNWPLRGLFWLSKDFFDDDREAADPDAKALYTVRNHLEHKFLRIHEFASQQFAAKNAAGGLGFSIERDEFERLTLHLLKLCRAALIYLSMATEAHEQRNKPVGLTLPVFLPDLEDDWKR